MTTDHSVKHSNICFTHVQFTSCYHQLSFLVLSSFETSRRPWYDPLMTIQKTWLNNSQRGRCIELGNHCVQLCILCLLGYLWITWDLSVVLSLSLQIHAWAPYGFMLQILSNIDSCQSHEYTLVIFVWENVQHKPLIQSYTKRPTHIH